ncbi:MAG: hypothetical protein O7E52_20055 [Candidatus Poribacteria bacterium]|nr:hypothetical protein [Candidatus Poribacteria bacterium]
MYRYLFLLLIAIYGCHRVAQPNAQPLPLSDEKVAPDIPEILQIESEEKTVTFAVVTTDGARADQKIYLSLTANTAVTTDQVMDMAGDIIDAFIARRYYTWLQMRIETSEAQVVKITCIATGKPSTTESTELSEMTPYATEVTIEAP